MDHMLMYYGPLAVGVLGNVLYNIFAKQAPDEANTFAFLTLVYGMGIIATAALFFFTSGGESIIEEFGKTNWASYALGLTIVGCDVSIILLYRAGWDISIGTLVANISVSLLLVVLGFIFWDEPVGLIKIAGIFICLVGLFIVNKPEKREVTA